MTDKQYELLKKESDQKYNGTRRNYQNDHWQSDWNGDEVGYPECDVVGLYSIAGENIDYYVNTETGIVLETFPFDPEE